MSGIPFIYHISLAAKRGVLRGQLIDDDVDGQRQKHHDHAHHQDALGACPSWADLVHPEPKEPDADVPDTRHGAENQIQDQGGKHDVVQRKHLLTED